MTFNKELEGLTEKFEERDLKKEAEADVKKIEAVMILVDDMISSHDPTGDEEKEVAEAFERQNKAAWAVRGHLKELKAAVEQANKVVFG